MNIPLGTSPEATVREAVRRAKLLGVKGDDGAAGPPGPTGSTGPAGPTGPAGADLTATSGYWTPLTDGEPSPDFIFTDAGSAIAVWVPTP